MKQFVVFPRRFLTGLVLMCVLELPARAAVVPSHLFELESVGMPAAAKEKAGRSINRLFLYQGRLYVGTGDATVNTGPTDVVVFDPAKRTFVKEFSVDDEAIHSFRTVGDRLVIPGVDATESWDFGNIYVLTDAEWVKRRTLPHAVHVFDVVSFKDAWYAGTGTVLELSKEDEIGVGGVFRSTDEGRSWTIAYTTPSDDSSVYRIQAIAPFRDSLYAFVYAYGGLDDEQIPSKYRPFLSGEKYEEKRLIYWNNVFGGMDAVRFDGTRWSLVDLVPGADICRISAVVFKDRLVLSVLSGEYVEFAGAGSLPGNASTALYAYDGETAKRVPLDYDLIRDVVVKGDRLYYLIQSKGHHYIAETADLETFTLYALPDAVERPRAIETDGKEFFVGSADGNLFRSTAIVPWASDSQVASAQPSRVFVTAEMPREGRGYWLAVTGWDRAGDRATVECERGPNGVFRARTEKVSSFLLFPPEGPSATRDVRLEVDGQPCFAGKLGAASSLEVTKKAGAKWAARRSDVKPESFQGAKKIVGRAEIDMEQGDPWRASLWLAEAFRWAAGADIALVGIGSARTGLKTGDITVEDLFDMCYRDTLCRLRVTGEKLRSMLDHNVTNAEEDRFVVAGFDLSYESHKDAARNRIRSTTLDPAKEYTVVVPGYVAKEAARLLGAPIECSDLGELQARALIRWIEDHKTVKGVPQTVSCLRITEE